jgi:hypothetical protein
VADGPHVAARPGGAALEGAFKRSPNSLSKRGRHHHPTHHHHHHIPITTQQGLLKERLELERVRVVVPPEASGAAAGASSSSPSPADPAAAAAGSSSSPAAATATTTTTNKPPIRYTLRPIADELSFDKGFYVFIRALQLLRAHNDGVVVVGLAGPSGSGKTAFSARVQQFMPGVAVVSMDMVRDER